MSDPVKKRRVATAPLHTLGGGPKEVEDFSPLQLQRLLYVPRSPASLIEACSLVVGDATVSAEPADATLLRKTFPRTFEMPLLSFTRSSGASAATAAAGGAAHGSPSSKLRIGVVFCGRQTPGAHNVVWGVYDAVKKMHPEADVMGFLDGTKGLFAGKHIIVDEEVLSLFRNQGGFEMLGRTVDQIRTPEQLEAAADACTALRLNGLVLVGGTYTNTDAAYLAEYMLTHQAADVATAVVGIPGSIDGDLKNSFIETTFGFDTACKLYSQLVGNMATDGASAAKYYYFVRVMGRTASHIALECALHTKPNVVLIGEQLSADKSSLPDVINHLADVVVKRAAAGKNYGLVLVPEGLIMHISELVSLVDQMNRLLASGIAAEAVRESLHPWNRAVLDYLPPLIRDQLFSERESHGTLQLSQISTEALLADLVSEELARRKTAHTYSGSFAPITHFFGYQARCALPSNFDCDYAYGLGRVAALLVAHNRSGYAACLSGLHAPASQWQPHGVPLSAMMHASVTPAGEQRPIISSTPLDLHSHSFNAYKSQCGSWEAEDHYDNPGPMQFRGPTCDSVPRTVALDNSQYLPQLHTLRKGLAAIKHMCRPGVSPDVLETAVVTLGALGTSLELMLRKH